MDDMEASFTALDISRSQNNYNTVSHKGLQSYISLPMANDSLTEPIANGPATEPLPLPTVDSLSNDIETQLRLEPSDQNISSIVQVNTIKIGPEPSPWLESPAISLDQPISDLNSPTTTTLTTKTIRAVRQQNSLILQPLPAQVQRHSTTSEDVFDAPDSNIAASRRRKARSIIGNVVPDPTATPLAPIQDISLITDEVKDPAKAEVVTMKHLPSIDRHPHGTSPPSSSLIKMYPPGTQSQREKLQDSDLRAILTSHGVIDTFPTRSELLAALNNTFPITTAPGRQFYFWDDYNKKFYCNDSFSFRLGWETRLSRAGEKYFYNTFHGTSVWDDPRAGGLHEDVDPFHLDPNARVKPLSNPGLQQQGTHLTKPPPSIPMAPERERAQTLQMPPPSIPMAPERERAQIPQMPNLPEGWVAEFIKFAPGNSYCW